MPLGMWAVLGKVYDVVQGIDGASRSLGSFIAEGEDTGIAGYVRDQYRARCRQYSNVPGWVGALLPIARRTLDNACSPYLDNNGWDSPVAQPTPPGGQCSTLYNAQITYIQFKPDCSQETFGPEVYALGVQGPLSVATDNVGVTIQPGGFCPGASYGNIRLLDSTGGQVSQRGSGAGVRLISVSYSRVDGLADDCGSQPPLPVVPGPAPAPNPGPIDAPDPTNNPGDPTDPVLPIPPYDDPKFGPIPFDFPSPPGGSAGGPVPVQQPVGSPENIGGPIEGGPGTPNEDGDIDFGSPPPGRAWVGCMVRVLYPEETGVLPNSVGGQDVFPRVVGNLSLKHGVRTSTSLRIRSQWSTLFRSSDALPVDGVLVGVLPSFSYQVYPVSVETCPEDSCSIQEV